MALCDGDTIMKIDRFYLVCGIILAIMQTFTINTLHNTRSSLLEFFGFVAVGTVIYYNILVIGYKIFDKSTNIIMKIYHKLRGNTK